MNAKRLLIPILLLCTVMMLIIGCAPKEEHIETEFDDMEISKIETSWHYGIDAFPCEYTRTFDFKHGTVCDTRVTNTPEYIPIAEIDKYNNPTQIATFTEEQAKTLYEKIKALGFLAWKDEYITDDIICDGGSERVIV